MRKISSDKTLRPSESCQLSGKYLQGPCHSWLCSGIAEDAYHITLIKHILIMDCFCLVGVQRIKHMAITFSYKHLL